MLKIGKINRDYAHGVERYKQHWAPQVYNVLSTYMRPSPPVPGCTCD